MRVVPEDRTRFGPADRVTLARAVLAFAVAGLATAAAVDGLEAPAARAGGVELARPAGVPCARARRGRRLGGSSHRHGERVRGSVRPGGGRVPHRGAQRARRPRGRLVGGCHRRRALRPPRGAPARPVAADRAPTEPVAQGRRGVPRDRPHGRGRARPRRRRGVAGLLLAGCWRSPCRSGPRSSRSGASGPPLPWSRCPPASGRSSA